MATIGPNTTVTIDYTLSLGNRLVSDKESLKFRYGAGEILPKLEEQLAGLSVGQEKYIIIGPHDGFGELDPQLIRVVPVEVFPSHREVKVGQTYQGMDQKGKRRLFYIRKIEEDRVIIDYNHPLAGKTLYFHVVVRDIETSPTEGGV